jgi:hypothetical protein
MAKRAVPQKIERAVPQKKVKGWRSVQKIHPACELLPLLTQDELKELAADIKQHGLKDERVPLTPDKQLLDGRNRLDALELNGVDVAGAIKSGDYKKAGIWPVTEKGDPYAFVMSRNIHRRHLDLKQKRELVGKLLEATPEKSDRQIGKIAHVDGKTVAKVRQKKEASAEIPQTTKRKDAHGHERPAKPKKAAKGKAAKPKATQEPQSDDLVISTAEPPSQETADDPVLHREHLTGQLTDLLNAGIVRFCTTHPEMTPADTIESVRAVLRELRAVADASFVDDQED